MSVISRRKMLGGLAVTPLAGGLVTRASNLIEPSQGGATSSRAKLQARYFPNFEVTTHEGKKVRFYDDLVKDKIVVINFMYAQCEGICAPITRNLKRVQSLLGERVGRDIFMYSISLKPEEDNPQKLKHYMQMHRIKPGWTFLTGKPDEIDTLRRKLGFSDTKAKLDKDLTNHIGMIRYGNEARQWWAMCPGQANPPWIVESILWMDPKGNEVHTHNTKTKTGKVS
ncbi:MAG TPA: SCO family protein [Pyrinomonadaceae bacterium]|nr:SCO family protein [Pyrinomonadaceae bacterium]